MHLGHTWTGAMALALLVSCGTSCTLDSTSHAEGGPLAQVGAHSAPDNPVVNGGAPPFGPALNPGDLLGPPPRLAAFSDSDRRKVGVDFEPGLSHLATAVDSALQFTPDYDGAVDEFSDAAWAIYRFTLPGYADSPLLALAWDTPPASYSDAWIGLGNQQEGIWEWRSLPENNQLDFGTLVPYIDEDQLLIAVVLTGTTTATLALVTVGDDVIPVADITAIPDSGSFPLAVELSSAGSSDPDGSIVKHEWDLDGDGIFELDSGADLDVNFTYDAVGSYTAHVRITDNEGATAEDAVTISVNDPDMNPPVADLVAMPSSGDAPLLVTLDASASSDDLGIVNYDWDTNGDGFFETLDSLDATVVWTYQPGTWNPVVRVEDTQGQTDTAEIEIISDAPANAYLTADDVCTPAPSTLLDASNSYEQAGTIVKYRWDKYGDGNWIDTGANPSLTFNYTAWGRYQPAVEVTDDDGDTDTASIVLHKAITGKHQQDLQGTGAGVAVRGINSEICVVYEDNGAIKYIKEPSGFAHTITLKNPPDTSVIQFSNTTVLNAVQVPFAVFYNSDGDMVCARSKKSDPAGAGDWDVHNIQNSSSAFSGNYACGAGAYGFFGSARLVVSYFDESDNELYFAVSKTAYPSSDADWTRHIVDTNGLAGKSNSLAVINGKPVICYYRNYNGIYEVIYAKASVSNPDDAADWSFHTVYTWLAEMGAISLAMVGGKPAVSFALLPGGNAQSVYYAYASTADPAGQGDWTVVSVQGGNNSIGGTRTGLMDYQGVPLIIYKDKHSSYLCYAWATQAQPGHSDWCEFSSEYGMANYSLSIAPFDGKPLIGIYWLTSPGARSYVIYGK